MGCDSIVIKDMAGLLTPNITAELVKALVDQVSIPVHLHSHATAGLASMCQYKAAENGVFGIDTAISSFAEGTSHPPTESMVAAFSDTEFDTGLDLIALQEIGFYFYDVRKKYHQFESEFTGLDTRVQVNHVPGGMISNLSNQLKEQGALTRMNDVLKEIPLVRKELGNPPLVTPTSQIVGTQAVLNVLGGERYKTITNEVKLYLQGKYGKAPGKISPQVRHMAIGNEDVIECRPADLLKDEMDKLRKEIGPLAHNEDDVLTYAMFPDIGRTFLEEREQGKLVPEALETANVDSNGHNVATEFNVTIHGETYHIGLTGAGHRTHDMRPYYLSIDGVPEEIMVETLSELDLDEDQPRKTSASGKRPRATEPGHVTTSMPGVIIEVLVNIGDEIKAGDPVLITEAMKMETEIQAAVSGTVTTIHVTKGDSVTPDETLVEIQ